MLLIAAQRSFKNSATRNVFLGSLVRRADRYKCWHFWGTFWTRSVKSGGMVVTMLLLDEPTGSLKKNSKSKTYRHKKIKVLSWAISAPQIVG